MLGAMLLAVLNAMLGAMLTAAMNAIAPFPPSEALGRLPGPKFVQGDSEVLHKTGLKI